jgi:hypothetical protein
MSYFVIVVVALFLRRRAKPVIKPVDNDAFSVSNLHFVLSAVASDILKGEENESTGD